jgi:glucose uptake protein GlcU
MLPSINGLGVREGGFVILLGKIGVSEAAAVSLSFLSILIPMIISIAGGILFMMQKKIPDKKDLENVEKIF